MFEWLKGKKANTPVVENTADNVVPIKPSRDDLIAEAMSNAKIARNAIGQETLDKVLAVMQKKQQAEKDTTSPMEQAKKILLSMDSGKLADQLKAVRDENKTH